MAEFSVLVTELHDVGGTNVLKPKASAVVQLYVYDAGAGDNRGALIATLAEDPPGSSNFVYDYTGTTQRAVLAVDGVNKEGYIGFWLEGNTLLPDNEVGASKIAAGAITPDKIASGAIDTDKIADDAVTTDKIANNMITTDKIANGAVTSEKIEGGSNWS
jgi:hypothetical protein